MFTHFLHLLSFSDSVWFANLFFVENLFVVFVVEVKIVFLWSETHIHFNISKWEYWLFLCTFCKFLRTHNPRDWVLLLEDWCLFNNLNHKTQNKKNVDGMIVLTETQVWNMNHSHTNFFVGEKLRISEHRFKNKTNKSIKTNHTFRINSWTTFTPSPVKLLMGTIERLLWRMICFLSDFRFPNNWSSLCDILLWSSIAWTLSDFVFFRVECYSVVWLWNKGTTKRNKERKMNDKKRKYKPRWVPRIITGLSLEWTWIREIHSLNRFGCLDWSAKNSLMSNATSITQLLANKTSFAVWYAFWPENWVFLPLLFCQFLLRVACFHTSSIN